jgi:hypothetical protein
VASLWRPAADDEPFRPGDEDLDWLAGLDIGGAARNAAWVEIREPGHFITDPDVPRAHGWKTPAVGCIPMLS